MRKSLLTFTATLLLTLVQLIALGQKINGVSLVGHPVEIEEKCFEPIQQINANWVALMPYAFSGNGSAELQFNNDHQWWGEKAEGIEACIKMSQKSQLKVMVKPHIWLGGGRYTGTFGLETEEEWKSWESDYEDYILLYAKLCEKYSVPMFCIGTELDGFARKRTDFWDSLIAKVREVYSGKLTYAANWDSYTSIPFWDKLDYVGIDAYFPLSDEQTPNIKMLMRSWQPVMEELQQFSSKSKKGILFTEFGYRSVDKAAFEPWESRKNDSLNLTAQANALESLFKMFWAQEWFSGGFLWKWHAEDEKINGMENTRFTPQNKPAEIVVSKWFGKYYH